MTAADVKASARAAVEAALRAAFTGESGSDETHESSAAVPDPTLKRKADETNEDTSEVDIVLAGQDTNITAANEIPNMTDMVKHLLLP
jgi:hypothetical protein